jgi:protein O-mannosyl-transferase
VAEVIARRGWSCVLAGVVIVLAALAAYHNSLSGPFVFDAYAAITENPTIRHLWPLGPVLGTPPGGSPVSGRPVVNVSLAINYSLGGLNVTGYHAVNLAIHMLAGLTLFGVVRRTLSSVARRSNKHLESADSRAWLISLAAAALWTVHPLQTESVTYVAQRSESMVGLFYLLTLYGFIRGAEAGSQRKERGWLSLSVAACFLGMATKEVMATAPVMLFLYDRTFVAGNFIGAWRQRRGFYLSLASTWLLLAYLMAGTGARGGTVGFETSVPWWAYAITQCKAIVLYLRLSVWPHPLVIDYGLKWGGPPVVLAFDALVVGALATATVIGMRKRPALGFLGAWFFVILAPSSSVVPVATEIIAEHRMYLPLAAVVVLAVLGLFEVLGKRSAAAFALLGLGLALVTARRNECYRSELALWGDTVKNVPDNPTAHDYLGQALADANDLSAATREFTEASRLDPRLPGPRNNLGIVMLRTGRVAEALANYRELVRIYPDFPNAHANLGRALTRAGRIPDAIAEFQEALRLQPDKAAWHDELGKILARDGRASEAIAEFTAALRIDPGDADAQNDLGGALLQLDRAPESIGPLEMAIRLNPDLVDAKVNLGSALVKIGRTSEAIAYYRAALRLRPDFAAAHSNLGVALRILGRTDEAKAEFEEAERLRSGR